jgi:protein tyrosine/serine phosphatase
VTTDNPLLGQDRALPLRGAANARDLGGLRTRDGRAVRDGVLWRADALQRLEPDDVEVLADRIGLRTVVDLRMPEEAAREGRGLLAGRVDGYANLPVRSGDWVSADVMPDFANIDVVEHYLGYLEASTPEILTIIGIFADADRLPVVFHCAAGKDRTGVVAALVLDMLGVEHEEIVADYAATAVNLDKVLERVRASQTFREMGLLDLKAAILRAEPETMREFLRRLTTSFGGAATWARERGFEQATIDRLQDTLLI